MNTLRLLENVIVFQEHLISTHEKRINVLQQELTKLQAFCALQKQRSRERTAKYRIKKRQQRQQQQQLRQQQQQQQHSSVVEAIIEQQQQ